LTDVGMDLQAELRLMGGIDAKPAKTNLIEAQER
jgi:hypothetical protein